MNVIADVGKLCRQMDVIVDQYREELNDKAEAEAAFKGARAKRILKARADGEASSATAAETVADADDWIGDLRLKQLITEGKATSTKAKIESLKERIGYGRSLIANQREQDKLHSQDRTVT